MLIVRASPVSRKSNKKSSSSSSTPPPSVPASYRQGLALFLDCMALTEETKNDMLKKNASSSQSSSSSGSSSGSIRTNEESSRGHGYTDNTADDTNNDHDDDDDFQAVRTPVVQLMTIHKSKGLEFDAVVLCGMEEGGYYE
jgi:superfamily I DNA/RNA helicase